MIFVQVSLRRSKALKSLLWPHSRCVVFASKICSFPPLHDLGAHFDETGFRLALGEEGYSVDGLVDVVLC
jgi:hypothetical protein